MRPHHGGGSVSVGDVFLLLTDALAEWFLKQFEVDQHPWKDLQAIATAEQFASLMQELREATALRNDDVTLIVIECRNS